MNKIFCIGLSRTGTTSLHDLFVELGLKGSHFVRKLLENPESDIISQYDFFSDTPIPLLYKKLDKKYPGSKFILTKRNKQDWLESMEWMFKYGKIIWYWDYQINEYHKLFYGTNIFDEEILSGMYDTYHLDVEQYFQGRQQDILIINLGKHIEVGRICAFLGIPEKDVSFPIANSKRMVKVMDRIRYVKSRVKSSF